MGDIDAFVRQLRALPDYSGQMVHLERLPPAAAVYGRLRAPLPPALSGALARRGVERFYSHQAAAIEAAHAGQSLIVATGTASGKTLCYNVPVLESILADPLSRALYLFPTKALAQDQLHELEELSASPGLEHLRFGTYDGDTPQAARSRLRRQAALLLSNPDMLHLGILPNHSHWAAFFRHLRFVVIDEAHVYRGVFGSHMAALLRRLRRVCALYGAQPQFILCSATIANPGEHAERLIGQPMVVIDQDGAPRGPRQFVLWNPPLQNRSTGERASSNTQATLLFTELVRKGLRNITFVRARKIAELILLYTRDALRRDRPDLAKRISSYRSGYLPAERREIERGLFSGELLGVTATNALELGIDVGELDATVLVGYPGTIASTWQQAGRAGRGRREALNILVGHDDPLDQYFMRHPEELFQRPHEHALIDPQNSYILKDHLACAAFESPLGARDEALFGAAMTPLLQVLENQGLLEQRDGRWTYRSERYPAQGVSLRSSGGERFLLVNADPPHTVLEEIDTATAFLRVYPGAIYLHRAQSYQVVRLDLNARMAYARPADVTYYTQPIEINDVRIIRSLAARELATTTAYFGQVRVSQDIVGFRRKQQFTEAVVGEEMLDLPTTEFETQAVWFEVPPEIQQEVQRRGGDWAGGLHAVEHAFIGILPLLTMCDRNDIGGISTPAHPDTGAAGIFVYDGYPGGVGLARKGFELIEEWWRRTLQVVRECPCEAGCPSCIYSPKCGNNNRPLDKKAAELILRRLLAR